jgi:hypothetical protein
MLLQAGSSGLVVRRKSVVKGVWLGGVRLWRLGSGRGGGGRERRMGGEDPCVSLQKGNGRYIWEMGDGG